MALVQRIRLSRIRRPTTGAYYTHVIERARGFLWHGILALVPAALQISSERLAQDPGERTCLCQQRLWHVLCHPLGDLFFFCTVLARCTTECPDIPHVRDHRAVRAPIICRRCALRAGSPSELRGRPCRRTRTFTAGRAAVEAAHEQGWAVTMDEGVPVADLAQLTFLRADAMRLFRAYPVGVRLCSHPNGIHRSLPCW